MDLSFLKPLYRHRGPFASVYADLTRKSEDAPRAAELRWKALRVELEAQGAPRDTLRAIEQTIDDELEQRRSEGLVLFAAEGRVVLTERLPGPPRANLAHVSPLPHVLPYLAQRGERFPHVVAVVDRRGGALEGVAADGTHRHLDVAGDEDYPIRKIKASDSNQARFQRSAENVWKHNAKKVAHEIDRSARDLNAEVIVIAGDVRARTAVLEELSDGVLENAVEVDRNVDALDRELAAELDRVLDLKVTQRVMAVAERFEAELAKGKRAVAGLSATVEAARRGQIETLLTEDDIDSPARLWIGPDPAHVAVKAEDLRELGAADPQEVRADAALIRAVACTDGELVILPLEGPNAKLGVGAVLRFTLEE